MGGAYRLTFNASGAPQDFAQREFGAAVAFACGLGFVDPGYTLTPALDQFLQMKRDRLSCAELPATIPPAPPNLTQGLYRYLMIAAALVWKVTGVSWSALTPLFAVAYGLTLVAAYGIFRTGAGRVMSVAATFALTVSALHLGYLPYFRDYAKAPFILMLILIMARLAGGPVRAFRSVMLAAAFGLVLGIGFGFRNDLLVNIVPWAAVVILCLPGGLVSNLRIKAACLMVSATVFTVAAWPILAAYARGSNSGHVALLGLFTPFNEPLGIATPIYDVGYQYLDGFASALVNSFSTREYGHPVVYMSHEYDRTIAIYLLKIAHDWPADFMARAYASVLNVVELPFVPGIHVSTIPYGIHSAAAIRFYSWQVRALQLLTGVGLSAVGLALLAISARSIRAAVTLLLFLLYFAGYPAVQFHPRHFFHLEFIGWWALAYLGDRAIGAVWRNRKRITSLHIEWPHIRPTMSPAAVRVGAFAIIGTATVVLPLLVAREYQTRHARAMLRDAYLQAAREPLETLAVRGAGGGRVLVETPRLWSGRNVAEPLSTAYVVAEFSSRACDAVQVPVMFRYEAKVDAADFSHEVAVPVHPGDRSTFVFFPAFYNAGWSSFKGIELPENEAACLAGVFQVDKRRIPDVLLEVVFAPTWEQTKLYQTLARWETPPESGGPFPRLSANPSWYPLRLLVRPTGFALDGPNLEYRNAIVKQGPGASLVIQGYPDTPYSPVLQLKDQRLPAGGVVVATGVVRSGGIALGVMHNGAWIGTVNVTSPGPFVAVVGVRGDGPYSIVLSNRVADGWADAHVPRFARFFFRRRNDVTLDAFGWLPPEGAARQKPHS